MSFKIVIAFFVVAAASLAPAVAVSARAGFHGGGGGFHRGFRGGGWGFGFYGPYYPFDYEDYGGCYVARQRIQTRHGWRIRLVDVCE